jgi:ABC-type branched-subunit amino acid transport system substrate-binding protein
MSQQMKYNKKINKNKVRLISFFLLLCSFELAAQEVIKLGMSAAMTGPSAAIGQQIKAGISAYFNLVNQQGGVRGRAIELITKDDGYEPELAAANVRTLIDDDKVLALIGNVGTPTAVVTSSIIDDKQTLLFGAYTGASILRAEPPSRYIINFRPSYAAEIEQIINGLLKLGIKANEIAFFTQRDSYGDAGYLAAKKTFGEIGFKDTAKLAHGRYRRNTVNVENAVATILAAEVEPKAIIMAGSYHASAKFIDIIRADLPEVMFFNLSFVGASALRDQLPKHVNNVYVNQVVPSIQAELPVVEEYLDAVKAFGVHQPNAISLEGFIIAKLFHQGLLAVKGPITRESIIDSLQNLMSFDVGLGVPLSLSKNDHQASDTLWLTRIYQGEIVATEWDQLKQRVVR